MDIIDIMDNSELTCRELVELVTDYLEGALPAPERARFEAHIADCDDCTIYMQQARHTIELLGLLTEESLPTPARDDLLSVFRHWKQETDPDNDETA